MLVGWRSLILSVRRLSLSPWRLCWRQGCCTGWYCSRFSNPRRRRGAGFVADGNPKTVSFLWNIASSLELLGTAACCDSLWFRFYRSNCFRENRLLLPCKRDFRRMFCIGISFQFTSPLRVIRMDYFLHAVAVTIFRVRMACFLSVCAFTALFNNKPWTDLRRRCKNVQIIINEWSN